MIDFLEAIHRYFHEMRLGREGKIKIHPLSTGNLNDDGSWIDKESAVNRITKKENENGKE